MAITNYVDMLLIKASSYLLHQRNGTDSIHFPLCSKLRRNSCRRNIIITLLYKTDIYYHVFEFYLQITNWVFCLYYNKSKIYTRSPRYWAINVFFSFVWLLKPWHWLMAFIKMFYIL